MAINPNLQIPPGQFGPAAPAPPFQTGAPGVEAPHMLIALAHVLSHGRRTRPQSHGGGGRKGSSVRMPNTSLAYQPPRVATPAQGKTNAVAQRIAAASPDAFRFAPRVTSTGY